MSRTGDSAARRGTALAAAALACLALAAGVGSAQAESPDGSGIWIYNCEVTFTVINLTNYPLKTIANTVQLHDGCYNVRQPLYELDAQPQRTWVYTYPLGDNSVNPCDWGDGSAVVQAQPQGGKSTLSDCVFEVAFQDQHAHNLLESGSWVWLQPHGSGWSSSSNSFVHGRWATPLVDLKMHNMMTLIGGKCMVALYSPDNKNLVIVVQQYDEDANGWHDADSYAGWRLDWVDNDGNSVPR